jgi:transposase
MSGSARLEIQHRNEAIIDGYFEQGQSYATLAKGYGVDVSTVKKIILAYRMREGERVRKIQPVDPRSADAKPLSYEHWLVSLAVERFMTENGKEMTATKFGSLLNPPMGCQRVTRIRQGAYDLTLLEVKSIAEGMGITFNELLRIKND